MSSTSVKKVNGADSKDVAAATKWLKEYTATTQKAAREGRRAVGSTFVASEYIDMHMNPKNPDDTKTLFNGGACAAFAHCATPLSAMAAKNFAEMVNLGYLKTTDSLQEVARGMSAGVLLVTAKLTRHNKAGAYQTLTVQFKLVPAGRQAASGQAADHRGVGEERTTSSPRAAGKGRARARGGKNK